MAWWDRISEEPCGCRVDIPTGMITHYCQEHDPDRFSRWLDAATSRCVYAINGLCETHCPARDYCLPEQKGLTDCNDITEAL